MSQQSELCIFRCVASAAHFFVAGMRMFMDAKQKNYFIEFLRFIFSLCILFYHSWIFAGSFGNGIFNSGYLAVDFYFIVTGYLMMNSIYKRNNWGLPVLEDTFKFMCQKIKVLLPSLFVAFIAGLSLIYGNDIVHDCKILLSNKFLPELFQLGIFGYEFSVNGSWWYISAMIFVMAILYPFAKKYGEYYCKLIAPLVIVFTIGIIYSLNININDPGNKSFIFKNGFYKALIFIPLGNLAYAITKTIKSIRNTKFEIIMLSVFEVLSYAILILNMHYAFMGTFIFAVLLTLNISLTFTGITYASKVFRHSFWEKLGKYGFYIFLCNTSVRSFMQLRYADVSLPYKTLLFRFVVASCLLALLIYVIVEVIYKLLIRKYLINYFRAKQCLNSQ